MICNPRTASVLRSLALLISLGVHSATVGADETDPTAKPESKPQTATAPDVSRGAEKLAGPQANPGVQWALVIGINYDDPVAAKNAKSATAPFTKLTNAEADAEAVYRVLCDYYGFATERTKLLKGRDATFGNIKKLISEDLLRRTKSEKSGTEGVQTEDSVLLFFAGHGYRDSQNDGGDSYLVPADVEYDEDGKVKQSSLLNLRLHIVEEMKASPARHKLLILDSCYSGEVYDALSAPIARPASTMERIRTSEETHQASAFQALTASLKKASDGVDGHSPFSEVLLQALKQLPHYSSFRKQFDASQLFNAMKGELGRTLPEGQSPQFGWLDLANLGEFSFFPRAELPPDPASESQIRLCLQAMVPGSFGNWWFEEMPWFMPGLRYEILKGTPVSRSEELDAISRTKLLDAALATMHGMRDRSDPLIKLRLEMLGLFLDPNKQVESRELALRDCLKLLDAAEKEQKMKLAAVDLHYRAVLLHGLGRRAGSVGNSVTVSEKESQEVIRKAYETALEQYKVELHADAQQTVKTLVPDSTEALHALCMADRGYFALRVEKKYEEAAKQFKNALSSLALKGSAPSRIYVLTYLADAYLAQDKWGVVDKLYREAFGVCREFDPTEDSPISAMLHSRTGWMRMQRCQVDDAKNEFKWANDILAKRILSDPHDSEAVLARFHNTHGLGMAARFAKGDSTSAVKTYRNLLTQLGQFLEQQRSRPEEESHFSDLRSQVIERWVNSMERLGDCHLFGQPPDYDEAADDYRRAARSCQSLDPDRRVRFEPKVYLKWALALCMSASDKFRTLSSFDQSVGPTGPALVQLEAARRDLTWAERYVMAADQSLELNPNNQDIKITVAFPAGSKDKQTAGGATLTAADEMLKKLVVAMLAEIKADDPCPELPKAKSKPKQTGIVPSRERARSAPPERTVGEDEESKSVPSNGQERRLDPISTVDADKQSKTNALRDLVESRYRNRSLTKQLPRDELEYLLFAAKFLTLRRDLDEYTRYSDAHRLLGICRMVRSTKGETLHYLRPYYDAAIEAQLELGPANSKELIEAAWEATHGLSYRKPAERRPILTYYNSRDNAYIFIDFPQRSVAPIRLAAENHVLALKAADGKPPRGVRLPLAVREELERLSERPGQTELEVRWRDPVFALGYTLGYASEDSKSATASSSPPLVADGLPTAEGRTVHRTTLTAPTTGSARTSPFTSDDSIFPFELGDLKVVDPDARNSNDPEAEGLARTTRN